MDKVETVIIGAGPAGLQCAKTIAEAGKDVLVLEKKDMVGPKVCAGGLTIKDLEFNIPNEILEIKFKKQIIHTPLQKVVVKTKDPLIITVNRKNLGQWMAREAKKAGAIIRTKTNVSEIKRKSIIANGKEIRFKYLVGADGAASLVRRWLGLNTNKLDVAMQYITKKKFKNMEFFLDADLFASGYAWIFPHKNYTSIGACTNLKYFKSNLKRNFHKWLKKRNIDIFNAKFESSAINYDYRGYKFKNKFLVGDAAGFASGLTGEGIYFAMVSGQEVARLIIDKKYKPVRIDRILEMKKNQETILNFINFSGPLQNAEYELLVYLLKNKFAGKEILDIFM